MAKSSSANSAIPQVYYAIFACYEPLLCLIGFIGAWSDPQTTHDSQAPWPADSPPPASSASACESGYHNPISTRLRPLRPSPFYLQLSVTRSLIVIGVLNWFVLSAARKHLGDQAALQEKIVSSLLTPLLIGDVLHLYVTLWALGDRKWDFSTWSPMLWTTIGLGLTLMIPRICWHLGVGRYVHSRDGHQQETSTSARLVTSSKSSVPAR